MVYDGVIFDFDGVLLDSVSDGFRWADRVREKKAQEFGCDYEGDEICFIFNCKSFEEMKDCVEKSCLTWEQYLEIERAVAERKIELVRKSKMGLYPGAVDVLKSQEVDQTVVSNACGETVDEIISVLGLDRFLEFWTAPRLENIERYHSIWKPETHMLEKAMKNMGSSNPVMVGDSWFDIKAAENAGIDSVLIERSHNADLDVDPDHRISSLEELSRVVQG